MQRKLALLREPHVAPLTAFVERMRAERGQDAVPWFDPTEAGVNARILLLLEAPGARAATKRGSGFVSPVNGGFITAGPPLTSDGGRSRRGPSGARSEAIRSVHFINL